MSKKAPVVPSYLIHIGSSYRPTTQVDDQGNGDELYIHWK